MEDQSIYNQGNNSADVEFINGCIREVCLKGDSLPKYQKMIEKKFGSDFYPKCERFVEELSHSVERKKFTDSSMISLTYLAKEIHLTDETIDAGVKYFNAKFDAERKAAVEEAKRKAEEKARKEAKEAERQRQQRIAEEKRKEEERRKIEEERKKSEFANCRVLSSGDMMFSIGNVSFKMVKVEGGTFWMGAHSKTKGLLHKTPDNSIPNYDCDAVDIESPVHKVTLDGFYMGETEVTQALWQTVMGKSLTQHANGGDTYGVGENYPMYYVSWDDCQEFISKLNNKLSSQLGGLKFTLPTEAEWEYAARGGQKSKGYKYSGSNTIDDVAWYCDNSGSSAVGTSCVHAVGTKRANELGLYDMSGNVWEWCADWFSDYSSSAQNNPTGLLSGSHRMRRGGDRNCYAWGCRVSDRNFYYPDYRGDNIGLRLALR